MSPPYYWLQLVHGRDSGHLIISWLAPRAMTGTSVTSAKQLHEVYQGHFRHFKRQMSMHLAVCEAIDTFPVVPHWCATSLA
eukprot:6174647-Pleurochrysis_carterae.AAC.3